MIFVLDATNKALKFTVSAGTDVHFTSHWADATASGLTEGQTQGVNTAGPDDVVPAPASSTRRVVKLITFHNTSTTTSRTVTLVNDVGGTSRTIAVFTLAPLATWYSDTAATTAIADGDKGDITVSASGATWTIDNNAITTAKILDANVTFAKIANITSGNLLGRTSGGSGPVQEITPGTGVLTWLQTPTADNLRAAVTGDTGTGDLVFSTTPTFATNITAPLVIGGTGTTSTLTLRTTSGTGATGGAIIFQAGTNGSTEIARMTNSGALTVGAAFGGPPPNRFTLYDASKSLTSTGNLTLYSTDTQNTGLGSTIGLGGRNGSEGIFDPWAFATLRGAKSNNIAANFAGYFTIGISSAGGTIFERLRIDEVGNFKIGGTADRATTAGTNQLMVFDGTAPVGTLANGCSFYSTNGEMRVMDAAGNATLLSPHGEGNFWIHDSEHTPSGRRLIIEVEKLLRFINSHFELDFIHETTIGEQ